MILLDITKTTKQISKDYELLTKKSWNLDKELNQFKYYLQASHKMRVMCHDSHHLADNLLEEANIMNEIRENGKSASSHTNPPTVALPHRMIVTSD